MRGPPHPPAVQRWPSSSARHSAVALVAPPQLLKDPQGVVDGLVHVEVLVRREAADKRHAGLLLGERAIPVRSGRGWGS